MSDAQSDIAAFAAQTRASLATVPPRRDEQAKFDAGFGTPTRPAAYRLVGGTDEIRHKGVPERVLDLPREPRP